VIVFLILLSVGSIAYSRLFNVEGLDHASRAVATFWVLANLLLLCVMTMCVGRRPRVRGEERFPMDEAGWIQLGDCNSKCQVLDLSLIGALVTMTETARLGDRVTLFLDDIGEMTATVVRVDQDRAGLRFGELPEATRDRLITALYASGRSNAANVEDRIHVVQGVVRRLLMGDS
jgi:hypothetical protein